MKAFGDFSMCEEDPGDRTSPSIGLNTLKEIKMKKIAVLPVQQLKTTSAAAYPTFLCFPS
jgi:hypothetical protein